MTPAEWTRPEHVVEILRRKWTSGRYLTAAADGHPFEPIGVPLKGPTAADALQHYQEALAWAQCWAPDRNPDLRIQTKYIGGRNGTPSNTVPARAWVDTRDRLWTLLRVTTQVSHFHTLHEQTARQDPGIARWMADHPMKALAHAADWHQLVRTTCWIRDHDTEAVYLREIDTPGVDTKFIETNKGILAELFDCVLPASRVNTSASKNDLVARYGFRTKPIYIRLRYLGTSPLPFSELTVRAEELADWSPGVRTVFVLENEITYLSLPPVPDAVAILGSGYAAALLRHLPWLDDVDLCYWGDIDTHGFAILDQVRGRFPHTTSLLMDRTTLLAHESHWGQEKTQARGRLTHLTPEEAHLDQDLRTGTYRPHLRLEQERIAITAVREALTQHRE
ncbi:Wadjet anti-phage system protein JetD domain-containing protein [Streptomyces sp. NPDC060085]|uniref:Wadjet anti-phage system protein JetD domain-containing protein n=1 Tax=Streptomyces sp. NPDC060085 TaxID=3347054 RepID=UPI003664519A